MLLQRTKTCSYRPRRCVALSLVQLPKSSIACNSIDRLVQVQLYRKDLLHLSSELVDILQSKPLLAMTRRQTLHEVQQALLQQNWPVCVFIYHEVISIESHCLFVEIYVSGKAQVFERKGDLVA